MFFVHKPNCSEIRVTGEIKLYKQRGDRINYSNGWAKTYTSKQLHVCQENSQSMKHLEISSEMNDDIITYSWTLTKNDNSCERGKFAVNRWLKYSENKESLEVTLLNCESSFPDGNDKYSLLVFIYPEYSDIVRTISSE